MLTAAAGVCASSILINPCFRATVVMSQPKKCSESREYAQKLNFSINPEFL
jgi:hypothetical protein